jgi:hypothetical protein
MYGLAAALNFAAVLAHFERSPTEVARLASDLIELSTRQNFAQWLAGGKLYRGWARSASGYPAEGIASIEDAIGYYRAIGSTQGMPFSLALKAEALHLADRPSEALAAALSTNA